MLTLKLDQKRLIKLNIAEERFYNKILGEKNRLLASLHDTKQAVFLTKLKTKVLREAARSFCDPHIWGFRFVQNGFILNIDVDTKEIDNTVHIQLRTA